MQFHEFLVCVHRINSRRRNEWSLEGFSYPIFINLLKILVLFCGMSKARAEKYDEVSSLNFHSLSYVSYLPASPPQKRANLIYLWKKEEKNDGKFPDENVLFPLDKFPPKLIMCNVCRFTSAKRTRKLINYLIEHQWWNILMFTSVHMMQTFRNKIINMLIMQYKYIALWTFSGDIIPDE